MADVPTTQRAYTLRLRGATDDPTDIAWHDALWATHEAANKGAKVFGDWLLTLRGGLDHRLAEDGPKEQRQDRRILLALSWLSVEDAAGAPKDKKLITATGEKDSAADRQKKLSEALRDILKKRKATDIDGWVNDCTPSLSAAIREDAVWVNRSAAFDGACEEIGKSLTRETVWDILDPFFGSSKSYLTPVASEKSDDDASGDEKSETAKDATDVDKAKDLVQKAGGWLSSRFGTGKGADFERMGKVYGAMSQWAGTSKIKGSGEKIMAALAEALAAFKPETNDATGILKLISGPGYKSATRNVIQTLATKASVTPDDLQKFAQVSAEDCAKCSENTGGKGPRPYSNAILAQVEKACHITYLQPDGPANHAEISVLLDHAARRVSLAHTWIKRAEAERRAFVADASKIGNVPDAAKIWLDDFCAMRSEKSGTVDEAYRIRKRALGGWDEIVSKWASAKCKTKEDRIAAARELQADPEINKFGDIQLFEALADDKAACVWHVDGEASAAPLKDYAAATDAEAKRRRFKVPAYRHPDALLHPVFCDFGNSRWGIRFAAHEAPRALADQKALVEKRRAELANAQALFDRAKTPEKQEKAQLTLALAKDKLQAAEDHLAWLSNQHAMTMNLWNGQTLQADFKLRWSSKRFVADLGLNQDSSAKNFKEVTRADRLGRAAAGAKDSDRVKILELFDINDWNGRLQAPRVQLDAIATHVEKQGWDAKAQTMLRRIRWLVSFSAKLQPKGPWIDYANTFSEDSPAKPFVSAKGDFAVKHDGNDKRKGLAKLNLCRLPGLRILSVDLGHRYAAACAVWEALTLQQMKLACKAAGEEAPSKEAMYLHLNGKNKLGKKTTTIYRRIGADKLADGTQHPAPWARLDRQFLVKLQGEEQPARKRSDQELNDVTDFEAWAGYKRDEEADPYETNVALLMSDTVRTARLALARHGRRARIAYLLTAEKQRITGGRETEYTDESRQKDLTRMLLDWHALATDSDWQDAPALALWNQYLADCAGGFKIARRKQQKDDIELTKADRQKITEELEKQLEPLVRMLAGNLKLRKQLSVQWKDRWDHDDEAWHKKLKWLSHWLMPRGKGRRDAGIRNVGGLSLTRISTLTEFRRKVQVGFFTRMKPDGTKKETGPRFGQSTLDTIERMKDNRMKQLASRIVASALGLGGHWKIIEGPDGKPFTKKDDSHRWKWVEDTSPRYAACHAVVIEDLTRYRAEETRPRRENRATMDWKSAEARKRLEDQCRLYGLYLRDVNPMYTSKQDSRTGAPGVRCNDVPVEKFMTERHWKKQILAAEKKKNEKDQGSERDRYLLALYEKYKGNTKEQLKAFPPIRIPLKGGEIFVSADPASPLVKGLQADLNAAANIGLRALMDPDFAGRWWYVPCKRTTGVPVKEKVGGCPLFENGEKPLGQVKETESDTENAVKQKKTRGPKKPPREIENRWRDVTATSPQDHPDWIPTGAYWPNVEFRVSKQLRRNLAK